MLVMLHVGVCCAVVSVPCSLVVTCWERADLLAVVFVVFCQVPKCFQINWFKPSSKIFLLTVSRRYFFCGSFVFFVWCVSHAIASDHSCLVETCLERSDFSALVGDIYCIFVTFLCGILDQVWYLIVSFPDLCLLSYFV